MLPSATYRARPYPLEPRKHQIPIRAIRQIEGAEANNGALDKKRCLFEIFVESRAHTIVVVPPVVLKPAGGGEVYLSQNACPGYPELAGHGGSLIVRLTVLGPI